MFAIQKEKRKKLYRVIDRMPYIFSNFKVTTIEFSASLGTPGIALNPCVFPTLLIWFKSFVMLHVHYLSICIFFLILYHYNSKLICSVQSIKHKYTHTYVATSRAYMAVLMRITYMYSVCRAVSNMEKSISANTDMRTFHTCIGRYRY